MGLLALTGDNGGAVSVITADGELSNALVSGSVMADVLKFKIEVVKKYKQNIKQRTFQMSKRG